MYDNIINISSDYKISIEKIIGKFNTNRNTKYYISVEKDDCNSSWLRVKLPYDISINNNRNEGGGLNCLLSLLTHIKVSDNGKKIDKEVNYNNPHAVYFFTCQS